MRNLRPLLLIRNFLSGLDRPFLWSPFPLGVGIVAYFQLTDEPGRLAIVPLAMAAVALLALALHLRGRTPAVGMGLTAAALVCLGIVAGSIDTARHQTPMISERIGPLVVEGTVFDRADTGGIPRAVLADLVVDGLPQAQTPHRVRIRLAGQEDIEPDQRIRVRAVLTPARGPAMPGAFDFRRYAYFQGFGAVGFAIGTADVISDNRSDSSINPLESLRYAIGERIRSSLPDGSGAVAMALLVGERGRISNETTEALRAAGLAHLLAISGLHVGLVAGLIFFVVRAGLAASVHTAQLWPIKKIAAAVALFGCLAYVALVGSPVPTMRAFIMALVVLLAVMMDRTAISLRTVALAAIIVMLIEPNAVLGASFQLSFGAVTALVATYEWFATRQKIGELSNRTIWGRVGRYLGAVLLTTLVASLATLPFSLFHFSRFTPWSLAANAIGVPLTAFAIMPLGMLSLLLMPFGLEGLPLTAMGWAIDLLVAVATEIATWPLADSRVPAMPSVGLLLAVLGGLWLCLTSGAGRLLGVPLIIAALASPVLVRPPAILVAQDLSLIGIVDPGDRKLVLSTAKSARFVRNVWLTRLGIQAFDQWPDAENPSRLGRCDNAGCRFSVAGRDILVANRPRALAEDCGSVSLIILARDRMGSCATDVPVIDSTMLRTRGSLALYPKDETSWTIVGAGDRANGRPWSMNWPDEGGSP